MQRKQGIMILANPDRGQEPHFVFVEVINNTVENKYEAHEIFVCRCY